MFLLGFVPWSRPGGSWLDGTGDPSCGTPTHATVGKEGRGNTTEETKRHDMELFDAHCHLQDARMGNDTTRWLEEAKQAGVRGWVCNGTQPKDWEQVHQLAWQHQGVVASYGLHPWHVERVVTQHQNERNARHMPKENVDESMHKSDEDADWLTLLARRLSHDPTACVGEAGLDFAKTRATTQECRENQREALRQQMRVARAYSRPISLHCVKAHVPTLELLKEEGPFPMGVLIHGYLGPPECIRTLVQAGCSFSLGGHLAKIPEGKAQAIVHSVPMERLMLETDCPDGLLTKEAQGTLPESANLFNHPGNLQDVLKLVARMRGMEAEGLAEISSKNARAMFLLPT